MSFFNKKEDVIKVEITPHGRKMLSEGRFKPYCYAFFDDDILYDIKYSASFGRQLEYYTGLVFKIDVKIKSNKINIINGGRYDNLIGDLGSNKKIPAVGAAINLND